MLGFVTSLPHPVNCASYLARSELLVPTLRSVLRQTDPEIYVVVVANEPPRCALPTDDRLDCVLVGYPPKASKPGQPSDVDIASDKGAKLTVGSARATAKGCSHIMWVDSDDFIHREIAAYVASEPEANGWYFDSGYFHIHGSRSVRSVPHEYHQRNGTSHVVRTDLVGVPGDLDPTLDRDAVLDRVGRYKVLHIMGRHRPIVEFFAGEGTPLAPFPFPAAIWELGTGENCSRVVATAGRKEPIDGRIADDFGLILPSRADAVRAGAENLVTRMRRRLGRDD